MERALDLGRLRSPACWSRARAPWWPAKQGAEPLLELLHIFPGWRSLRAPAVLCGEFAARCSPRGRGSSAGTRSCSRWCSSGPAAAAAWEGADRAALACRSRGILRSHGLGAARLSRRLMAAVRRRARRRCSCSPSPQRASRPARARSPPRCLRRRSAGGDRARRAARRSGRARVIAAVLVGKGLGSGPRRRLARVGPVTRAARCARASPGGRHSPAGGADRRVRRHARPRQALLRRGRAALRRTPRRPGVQHLGEPVRGAGGGGAVRRGRRGDAGLGRAGTSGREGVRGWFAPLRHGPRAV